MRTVALVMIALYISIFLVALVSLISIQETVAFDTYTFSRTESSYRQLSQRLQIIFIQSMILDGMEAPTFSPGVLLNSFSVASTSSITTKSSF